MNDQSLNDQYTWWRNALKGDFGDIHESGYQAGFYRKKKHKGGPFVPVAIWHDDEWICLVDNDTVDVEDVWLWCCGNPISKADYYHYIDTGQWSDAAPAIGDNKPPEGFEALKQSIEENASEALKWLDGREITTKADADKAGNMKSSLQKLYSQAENERKAKKRPHLDANTKIDAEYKPLLGTAENAKTALNDSLTIYLNAEDAKEEKRVAEIERKEREKEIELRKKIADDAAKAVLENREPEPIPEPELKAKPIERKKVSAGGATGNRVTLRTYKIAEIIDLDKAFEHWKDHPSVQAAIKTEVQKLANATIKTGEVVPGVEIKEERRAV